MFPTPNYPTTGMPHPDGESLAVGDAFEKINQNQKCGQGDERVTLEMGFTIVPAAQPMMFSIFATRYRNFPSFPRRRERRSERKVLS